MRKLDFDWLEASKVKSKSKDRFSDAQSILKQYRDFLVSFEETTGHGVGNRYGEPYIVIFVKFGKGEELCGKIPDRLGDYDVYYTEMETAPLSKS